ncbi:MAG: DUF2760 domain-containing protein [Candidatus Sumerlaeia bacterium]|nr:DUF2760 domain-containing protein [Candidatus Sumerlaeia bacterium]
MHLAAAFKWFFKILREGEPAPPAPVFASSSEPAIQLLGLLQKEGRLVDFLMEDMSGFSDAEIGAAARDIHGKCRNLLKERAALEPVVPQAEGAPIEVPAGFDASAILLSGNVSGAGPFKGTVNHRGWRVARLDLPTVPHGADPKVAAPAEVEVR